MNPPVITNDWQIELIKMLAWFLPLIAGGVITAAKYFKSRETIAKIEAKENSVGETAINELKTQLKSLNDNSEQVRRNNEMLNNTINELKKEIHEIRIEFVNYLKSRIKHTD